MQTPKSFYLWAPLFVLVAALASTAAVTWQFARTIEAKDQARFNNQIQYAQDAILARIDSTLALLRSGAGLFAASGQVERDEFRAYVERLDLRTRYPGIQGIGFSRRVAASERAALVQAARAAGAAQFLIWPEHERSEYYTIYYLEPLDERNQAALGYDMYTEPTGRALPAPSAQTSQAGPGRLLTKLRRLLMASPTIRSFPWSSPAALG